MCGIVVLVSCLIQHSQILTDEHFLKDKDIFCLLYLYI